MTPLTVVHVNTEHGFRGELDVYVPKAGAEKAPVLLQIHGGAWMIGEKEQQGRPLMTHLVERGWVCVAINYRLVRRHQRLCGHHGGLDAAAWRRAVFNRGL